LDLAGLFGFLDAEDINRALLDLEKVLNSKQNSVSIYIEEWQHFAEQFKKWFYENLKICLENVNFYKFSSISSRLNILSLLF
jgi:hypothetical protein